MNRRYPFKFLDAYNKADTDIFFGRDEEVEALYQMTFQSDILLVYGASGTGKTSLINCGLASRFQAHDWLALNIRRGNDLNASLQQKLEEATAGSSTEVPDLDLSWLDEDEAEETDSPLSRQLQEIYRRHFRPVYLIFDQFEELYVLGSKAEQAQFIRNVQEIQAVDQPVKMIFVIREEYLGHLFEFERAVPQLLRKKLRVEPMNLDKVGQVVRGAAALDRSNVRLEAGQEAAIVEGIFGKIRGSEQTLAIQLPYLQVFLDKLYLQVTGDEARQAEAVFTTRALAGMGDIGDVLRDFLEEQAVRIQKQLSDQYPKLPEDAVWQILSPLATLEGTKEPLLEETLLQRLPQLPPGAVRAGLQALDQSRILRYDENEGRYEVAHDSLAARIAEHRNDDEIAMLEIRRLISSQMALKAEARALFTAKQLNLIDPYLDKLGLEPAAVQLIEDSRRWLETEARKKRRRNLIIVSLWAIVVALTSTALAFALIYISKLRQANLTILDEYLEEIDSVHIYTLNYPQALERISAAASLSVGKDEVRKRVLELAFFYNESGDQESAIKVLRRFKSKVGYPVEISEQTIGRVEIRQVIKHIDKKHFEFLEKRYYPKMIAVKGGEFTMGCDPKVSDCPDTNAVPAHSVQISLFKIGLTEVTNWQYALFQKTRSPNEFFKDNIPEWGMNGDNPVVGINWYDAARYTNWLNNQFGQDTVYVFEEKIDQVNWKVRIRQNIRGSFRLPTEAEWEYAARGGRNVSNYLYSGSISIDSVGWYRNNSQINGQLRTHPVSQLLPNSIGLYDMTGNAWEWCQDWYDQDYYDNSYKIDPLGPEAPSETSEKNKVLRGGCYYLAAKNCRVDDRSFSGLDLQGIHFTGFRIAFR